LSSSVSIEGWGGLLAIYKWNKDEKVTAVFDSERKNRFLLNCTWDPNKPSVAFILINPSKGDELVADPTLRRCVNFSKEWGYGSMNVVNLYSEITDNPDNLGIPLRSTVTENNKFIKKAINETDCVIFGWGELEKSYPLRVREIKELVPNTKQFCIKKTTNGLYPRHPLFLSAELNPIPWNA
jgi:hypothetical protein